jgi:hypothetical protein
VKQFIRIRDRFINLEQVSYIEFFDSGRAMIYVPGLHQEKAHIQVDPADAIRLKAMLESEGTAADNQLGPPAAMPQPLFSRR